MTLTKTLATLQVVGSVQKHELKICVFGQPLLWLLATPAEFGNSVRSTSTFPANPRLVDLH
jgi:hypothetical protein